MVVAFKINVYGATRFRDSTNKLIGGIESNTIKEAETIGRLLQSQVIRNSQTMIPHKYSTLNRLNGNTSIPLSKQINLVRTKQRQYSLMAPRFAFALDKGSRIKVLQPHGKKMRFISSRTGDYVFTNKPIIHPGNPAYNFITLAQAQLPKMVEQATGRIMKKNKAFYN